ncbi:adenylate/guanylate cyclase domain-containing protein [Methylocapsa palsarum]|uniref:Adenylate cyclase n=1 Tax=Methylocapsa palsarum TaxID=1612308 RepID=A0A1I4C2X4_9HYPH|nr:adenylate/guanylate cyclase domain-containing protein [Methylocapsa palsarum]SFK74501.1 adenylate cyclase [Methylocapsa palsarum]
MPTETQADRSLFPIERNLRLVTGLALFTFAACHFLNHACGIFGLAAMEATRKVLIWPWRTFAGQTVLYGSFLIHGSLGLYALYRRRHLRIPPRELFQLLLGLSIPALIIVHATNVRLGHFLYGLEESYPRVLYRYWVLSPLVGLSRQFALLVVLWIHGCLGLHFWLRFRTWYTAYLPLLAISATMIPVLAVIGIADGGRSLDARLERQDGAFLAQVNAQTPQESAVLSAIGNRLILIYLGLVVAVFLLRALREWRRRRIGVVKIEYPEGREAVVPRGFSILEASRWAGISHTSICGGRGRCSTCRVLVTSGLEDLHQPNAAETNTLCWIGACKGVRLACQVRPRGDLKVVPLLTWREGDAAQLAAPFGTSEELEIAAFFVDLRNSTRLADGRLPFDSLYIIDRYVAAVTYAAHSNGGLVTSVAGDGVMCVFGADCDATTACRRAILAMGDLWRLLALLNEECESAFDFPLRFGGGCHIGLAVVGKLVSQRQTQFVGEVGNVAARLEALTKEFGCTLVLSRDLIERARLPGFAHESRRVQIKNVTNDVEVIPFHTRAQLRPLIASIEATELRETGKTARRT